MIGGYHYDNGDNVFNKYGSFDVLFELLSPNHHESVNEQALWVIGHIAEGLGTRDLLFCSGVLVPFNACLERFGVFGVLNFN
jgi:hypothetical protein